ARGAAEARPPAATAPARAHPNRPFRAFCKPQMAEIDVLRPSPEAAPAPEISVVVTLLNEGDTVEELYRRTVEALGGRSFEVVFVDDGSTDQTFAAVERLHAADPRVR